MKIFVLTTVLDEDGNEKPAYKWLNVDTKKPRALRTDGGICVNGTSYSQEQILKVIGDVRGKSEYCNNCGLAVPANKIEDHYAEEESKADCLNCPQMVKVGEEIFKKKVMKKCEDGTYEVRETHRFKPRCRPGYGNFMTKEDAIENGYCRHYRCRAYGTTPYDREHIILMRMPEFFKIMASEKALIANGWTIKDVSNAYRIYKHPTLRILATVNNLHVVESFAIYKRNWEEAQHFLYSYKYKRLCDMEGRDFEKPLWVTDEKMGNYVAQIRRLFE